MYGKQLLCLQSDQARPTCGTDITRLTTDQKGQLHLLYFAPGIAPISAVSPWVTDVQIVAKKNDCTSTTCQHQQGEGVKKLGVLPYLIYQHTGELTREEVTTLIELVDEGSSFWTSKAKAVAYEKLTEPLIEELEDISKAAEDRALKQSIASVASALKHAGPGLEIVHFIHLSGESLLKLYKQIGLIAALLDTLQMPGIGIDVGDPFSHDIPDLPSSQFMKALLHGTGQILPVFQGGVLWSDAEALAAQQKAAGTSFAVQPESITVRVFEVSHCYLPRLGCGPGYWTSKGIEPELCFDFLGTNSFPGFNWSDGFCESYNAAAFAWTQRGINKALP